MKKSFLRLLALALLPLSFSFSSCEEDIDGPENQEKRVDIGEGLKLNYIAQGKQGNATVVLISGMGEDLSSWNSVRPKIARYARVLAYDRANLGRSYDSDQRAHSRQIAEDLHKLLQKADVKAPFILVGHSMGGIHARVYQAMYPNEVKGLVMIDATPERLELDFLENATPEDVAAYKKFQKELAGKAPASVRPEYLEVLTNYEQVQALAPVMPQLPLAVLTSTLGPNAEAWAKYQKVWADQVNGSVHLKFPDAGHHIHQDKPDVVASVVQQVYDKVK